MYKGGALNVFPGCCGSLECYEPLQKVSVTQVLLIAPSGQIKMKQHSMISISK